MIINTEVNINVEPTPDMIIRMIDDYCIKTRCPEGCVFDKIGICTDSCNAFNTFLERYRAYERELNK